MPNDDTCIICCSAEMFQMRVLIADSDVQFLDDGVSHYNTGSKRGKANP